MKTGAETLKIFILFGQIGPEWMKVRSKAAKKFTRIGPEPPERVKPQIIFPASYLNSGLE